MHINIRKLSDMKAAGNLKCFIVIFIVVIPVWRCYARSHSHRSLVHQFENIASVNGAENETLPLNLGYFHVVEGISVGLEHAVRECKHQFRWDRWNCPVQSSTLLTKASVFKATKEAAYLQAISAAGIMYYVTKKCNHPKNDICGCDSEMYRRTYQRQEEHTHSQHVWKGCQQNVWFGEKVARIFLGIEGDTSTTVEDMKKHNELAGLKAVKRSLKTHCKYHGPTGSCTFKTCWKVLPDFRKIAARLKRKYNKSTNMQHQQKKVRSTNKVGLRRIKRISKHDLVYSETSPDYCYPDNTIGHLGTFGRDCRRLEKGSNKTSTGKWERSSCKRLCKHCGYTVARYSSTETYDCECKFKWCCTVECKQCKKKVWRYYCDY